MEHSNSLLFYGVFLLFNRKYCFLHICTIIFFFYTTLLKRLVPKYKFLTYFLYITNPIFFCVSIYYETGIGVVIGLVSLILLLNIDIKKLNLVDKVLSFILLSLASFVSFGYRANTFTILPALIVIVLIRQKAKVQRLLSIASFFVGLGLVVLIPKLLHINTMSSVSLSFIWEMGHNIANMPSQKQSDYIEGTSKNCNF